MKNPWLATCLTLALAGCAQPIPHAVDAGIAAGANQATVTVYATLALGGAADRHVLSPLGMAPWTRGTIDHLTLSLYKDNVLVATITVPKADLDKTISFTNLHMNSAYAVVARAWSDANETSQIDNLAFDAASCTTTFHTTTAENLNVGALRLRLRDKVFAGAGQSSGLTVTDGGFTDPTLSEAIVVNPATFTYNPETDPCLSCGE
ncbi:MAG: hypothetical protein ACK46X_02350 [Candidatus Sericytochromatia bacterium]